MPAMKGRGEITFEGYTGEEILALPGDQVDALVLVGSPVVFRAGSAEVIAEFLICERTFVAELAHIDGGGEGVLPALWVLAERFARRRGLAHVEWIVHARTCATPNPKLRRVLERRGFEAREIEGVGEVYYSLRRIEQRSPRHTGGDAP